MCQFCSQTLRSGGHRLIHKPQLEQFSREWKNCAQDEEQRSAIVEKQANVTETQERVSPESIDVAMFQVHHPTQLAQRFEAWHTSQLKQRSDELEAIRQQRLQE